MSLQRTFEKKVSYIFCGFRNTSFRTLATRKQGVENDSVVEAQACLKGSAPEHTSR